MSIGKEGETPRQEQLVADASGISHERLVKSFQTLIREQQQLYTSIRSPEEREVLPPEAIVRNQLDWYADTPNQEKAETFFLLRSAWDALAYDRYEIGSREEGLGVAKGEILAKSCGRLRSLFQRQPFAHVQRERAVRIDVRPQ